MRKGLNRMILRNMAPEELNWEMHFRWGQEKDNGLGIMKTCPLGSTKGHVIWSSKDVLRNASQKGFLRGKYACAQCYQHGCNSITKISPKSGWTTIIDKMRTKKGFLTIPGQYKIKDTVVKKDYIPWWKISKQSRRFAHYYYWLWQHRIQARVI